MNGPALIVVGVFMLVIGWARSFAARPEPGEEQTAYGRGDLVGSKILIAGGVLLLLTGIIWTVVAAFQ